MRDTCRRYRAIAQSILQLYKPSPVGHQRRQLSTLILMICGLVGSRHVHLPKVVEHTPGGRAADDSVVMRFRRLLKHDGVTYERWMLPVAQAVLTSLSTQPLVLVIDGSSVGRDCVALMMSVVYRGRALPLVWMVVTGKKGHFAQEMHCALLEQLRPLVPATAQVTILGDGEFDGTVWQRDIEQAGWHYVCRTGCGILLTQADHTITVGQLCPARGQANGVNDVFVTAEKYGPVSVVAVWEAAFDTPLYLVTNLTDLDQAVALYQKRAHIETFFSDQKGRGFQLDKSHVSDPKRLARLLIVSALAYLWVVYLGTIAHQHPDYARFHRNKRCDLSLFQLGFRLLNYCLRHARRLPVGIIPSPPAPIHPPS